MNCPSPCHAPCSRSWQTAVAFITYLPVHDKSLCPTERTDICSNYVRELIRHFPYWTTCLLLDAGVGHCLVCSKMAARPTCKNERSCTRREFVNLSAISSYNFRCLLLSPATRSNAGMAKRSSRRASALVG